MSSEYPVDESIYILKGDESYGPFFVDELLTGLDEGKFSYDDVCLRAGASDCERLRDILDWEKPAVEEPASEVESVQEEALEDETFEEEESTPVLTTDSILYSGHPSILTSPGSILSIIVGFIGGFWIYPVNPWLTLTGFLAGILALAYLSFMKFTLDYQITPKRIEVTKGLIARSSNEVQIKDIRAINISCRGFVGMLGIGTVDFFTTGDDPEVTFREIWAAKKVKALVRKLQDTL